MSPSQFFFSERQSSDTPENVIKKGGSQVGFLVIGRLMGQFCQYQKITQTSVKLYVFLTTDHQNYKKASYGIPRLVFQITKQQKVFK